MTKSSGATRFEIVDAPAVARVLRFLAARPAHDVLRRAVPDGVNVDAVERREAPDPLAGTGLLEDRAVGSEPDDRVVDAGARRLVWVEAVVSKRRDGGPSHCGRGERGTDN